MALHDLSFEFIDISECQGAWNFSPRHKLPENLPAWALGGFLISGFDLKTPHLVQNVTQASPTAAAELFFSLYPHLSWPEMVRLNRLPEINKALDCELLMTKYGAKYDERFQKTSDFLWQWPFEVQDYIAEKDIRAFDVTIVDQLSLDVQKNLLIQLVHLKASKSQFCQMLDLCGELILMKTPVAEILEILKSSKALETLRQKRFPQTSEKDLAFKNSLSSFPWPKAVTAQALRKGDVQGLEIKFFVKDAAELDKTLNGLQSVASVWKKTNEPDPALKKLSFKRRHK